MARIRGTNTAPERVFRSGLHRAGFRFRLHSRALPGRPDLVLPKYYAVAFVHGCFWHRHPGCADAATPKTRSDFWVQKLNGNRRRDARQIRALLKAGWRVLIVWECALETPSLESSTIAHSARWLRSKSQYEEIPAGAKSFVRATLHRALHARAQAVH